jgi:hypothetical protein
MLKIKKSFVIFILVCFFIGIIKDLSYCYTWNFQKTNNKPIFIPRYIGNISDEFQGDSNKKFIII